MTIRFSLNKAVGPKINTKEKESHKISDYFGINTFSEATMKQMISEDTYTAFKNWQRKGRKTISPAQADEIAHAMKDWAIAKGATAYTHWFQPLTGLTAEKHDSFITRNGNGKVLEKFSGSKLIQGEPDASSFPSGGLRATFEARGYTAWDPASPAFITEAYGVKTLCIPTIYISYNGQALDKKLPLIRSEEALNKAAVKLLNLFNHENIQNVYSTCGPEQEYFLIDKNYTRQRPDILLAGRTLVGAPSTKDQQLEDQYFGSIKERMLNFMDEVGYEAYKLGIPVTTRHNEVAPHQYEFAPIFEQSSLAADHNQLLMDIMKKVAKRHNFECLLHEKPFAGINGSGKHLNWSMSDNNGNNLLNPGDTPSENIQFLTILVSIIQAVYKHSEILRASVASAGNEHRLGANEAPPAIISIFLGSQLREIIDNIASGKKEKYLSEDIIDLGISRLPTLPRDNTDRNRTSPFAFTGEKFEFRTVGSTANIATPTMVINTIVAESINSIVEKIEQQNGNGDLTSKVFKVLAEVINECKDILFEGNNYSDEWLEEAKERGLKNIASTPLALKTLTDPKTIELFKSLNVLSETELQSRYIIRLEKYHTVIHIEAETLIEIAQTQILPCALSYQKELGDSLEQLHRLNSGMSNPINLEIIEDRNQQFTEFSLTILNFRKEIKRLEEMLEKSKDLSLEDGAQFMFEKVKYQMENIRIHADTLEKNIPNSLWELPKYSEMLFIG